MDERGKILVAYASRLGSTGSVAEYVGQKLREENNESVDVRHMDDVSDLSKYRAVILGSAIRNEKPLPELEAFVRTHKGDLRNVPVALFVLCLTMRVDTEENRLRVLNWLKPVVEIVRPVALGLFAGSLHYARVSPFMRLILRMTDKPQGDFRDWDAIHAWTKELPGKFEALNVT